MKTRDLMATMWIGLVIVAVTLGMVTVGVLYDNVQLRQEGRNLRTELAARSADANGLQTERDLAEEELETQRERIEQMNLELAELKLKKETAGPAASQSAYRIRAYLENQWVSQGWLVPGRATTNANGQLVYEPVVVLDPSARTALAASAPAEQAPEQPGSVTVNHNYPATYDTVWPAIWVAGGRNHQRPNRPPATSPGSPSQPNPQPQPASPFLSTRVWQPQTGFQRMAPGRPGGDWISSAPRGHSYISSGGRSGGFGSGRGGAGGAGGGGTGTFPAKY